MQVPNLNRKCLNSGNKWHNSYANEKELKLEGMPKSSTRTEMPLKSENLATCDTDPNSASQTPTPPKPRFCFKCGEDGHIAANCTDGPNPDPIQKKNAKLRDKRDRFWAQQGACKSIFKLVEAPATGRPGAEYINQISPIAMTHNVKGEIKAKAPEGNDGLNHTLSPALVGPCCVSTISMGDTRCDSILDTGSQVTTISETFHSRYIPPHPAHLSSARG